MPFSRWRSIRLLLVLPSLVAAQTVPLDALLRGGRIHYQGGRYERAREQFQKALEQHSASADPVVLAEINLWLGLCDAQSHAFGQAAAHFLRAIELDTTLPGRIRRDESQLYHVGTSLLRTAQHGYETGRYDSAVLFANAALRIDPSKPQIYSLIANAYSAEQRYDEMFSTARRMLLLDTASAEAYNLIGLYFSQKPDSMWVTSELRSTRWDSSLLYYRKALSIYETQLAAARKSLEQTLRTSDHGRLAAIEETLYRYSRNPDQNRLRRYVETALGSTQQQVAQLAAIASRLYYARSRINITCSRAGSAMLRASYEVSGDKADSFRLRAETLFNRAIEHDRADHNSLLNLGIALYSRRQDSAAAAVFEQVVQGFVVPLSMVPPPWRETLLSKIDVAAASVGYAQLAEQYVSITDSILEAIGYPGLGYEWLHCPELRNRTGSTEPSTSDTGLVLLSTEPPAQIENTYLLLGVSQTGFGLTLLEAQRTEAASSYFSRAIANLLTVTKFNPRNAEAYQNLIHCYRETGQRTKAEDAYRLYKRYSGN